MTTRNAARNALSVSCPVCAARAGRKCTSSRIGSASQLGGGWGGYSTMDKPHDERRAAAKAECTADVLAYVAAHADMSAKAIRVETNWNATTVRNVLAALVADGRIVCKSTTGAADVYEIAANDEPEPTNDADESPVAPADMLADGEIEYQIAAYLNRQYATNAECAEPLSSIADVVTRAVPGTSAADVYAVLGLSSRFSPANERRASWYLDETRCERCGRIVDEPGATLCERCAPSDEPECGCVMCGATFTPDELTADRNRTHCAACRETRSLMCRVLVALEGTPDRTAFAFYLHDEIDADDSAINAALDALVAENEIHVRRRNQPAHLRMYSLDAVDRDSADEPADSDDDAPRARRVAASKAFQAATRSTRKTIRSTDMNTRAPFDAVLVDTVTARLAALRLSGNFVERIDESLRPDLDAVAGDWKTAFGSRARVATVRRGDRAPHAGVFMTARQARRILDAASATR